MLSNKMIAAAILIAAFSLLPSACGITLSVSGDAGGHTETINAGANDGFMSLTAIADMGLSNSLTGKGNLKESHSVSNRAGAMATVGVDIRKAAQYSYSYNLIPGKGSGWSASTVQASESLNVKDADYAGAYSQAHGGQNDLGGSTEVTKGSLLGYSNLAIASANKISVS